MRDQLNFACGADNLAATLDRADGTAGLLIVSGGNEIRCGAHRGMAMLAADVAGEGHPVLRFDRRGIGDSEGENGGYRSSRNDLLAAITAFRAACPSMTRVLGFGNCDAASALLLHQPLELDGLILANPWTFEDVAETGLAADDDQPPALPPVGAIRARYLARLKHPASFKRLLRGEIDLGKLARGLGRIVWPAPPRTADSLGASLVAAIATLEIPIDILLATGDRTAQAFADHWDRAGETAKARVRIIELASASHSFAGDDATWLFRQILAALRR